MNIEKISLELKNLTSTGNVNGVFNVPTERMPKGILPLTNRTIKILKRKHPKPNKPASELLFQRSTKPVYSIIYEGVDYFHIMKPLIFKAIGSGPFGLDADGWKKSLISRSFGTVSREFRKIFVLFVKRLFWEYIRNKEHLESFDLCRLIPLEEWLGLLGYWNNRSRELLGRTAGIAVIVLLKKGVTQAAGLLLLNAGCNRTYFINRCWKCF